MPFKFDGRDYDLFPTKKEFSDFEESGKLESVLTNLKGDEIGAKVFISIAPNRNPDGVELMRDYSKKITPEQVMVKVSQSALDFMRTGNQIMTTYGITENKVRMGVYDFGRD